MHISSIYLSTLYHTSASRQYQEPSGIVTPESQKNNYDEITIRSGSLEAMDSRFAENLKTALIKDISQPASQEKLNSLKQKINDGAWQVNAGKIAEKIILCKGAESYE